MNRLDELATPHLETLTNQELSEEATFALASLRQILERQAQIINERELQLEDARKNARVDALTGLNNRGAFMQDLETLTDDIIESTGRSREPEVSQQVSWMVILGDLDYFKLVNDVLGYELGDATLTAVARLLRKTVRHSDKAYRLGGDEFAIVAPVTPGREVHAFQAITERFYCRLEDLRSSNESSLEFEALRAIDISFAPGIFNPNSKSIEDLELTVAETMKMVKGAKEMKGTGMR